MLAYYPSTPAHHFSPQDYEYSLSRNKKRKLSLSSSTLALSSDLVDKFPSALYRTTSSQQYHLVFNTSDIPIDSIDLYMPHSYDFSSSHSGSPSYAHDNLSLWSQNGGPVGNISSAMAAGGRQMSHQRHPSTSSVGSAASIASSQYQAQPVSRGMRGSGQFSGKQSAAQHSNQRQQSISRSHLPTPTQTPTRNTFSPSHQSAYGQPSQDMDPSVQASLMMSAALMHQQQTGADVSQANQLNATSYAAPSRSRTQQGALHLVHSDSMSAALIPKFNRTVSDAYQDNLYFAQPAATAQHASNTAYLMPGNQIVTDRLIDAQMARSQSSGSNQSQPMSPFRAYAQMDDQQYQVSPQASAEPKTISPKEALLDYKPANDYPLFPQTSAALANAYATASSNGRQDMYNSPADMNYNNQAWESSMQAFSTAPMQSLNSFATPALPTSSMGSVTQFSSNGSGVAPSSRTAHRQVDRTPEFTPAQLTRMESSASEAPMSSQASSAQVVVSPKPESAADSGTYSCTYHGCVQRFTTPQKLQKHKRDTHRNNPNVTPGVGSGMTTAQLMERNSQTGPHICGRTNPTTGKPCDAIFSRPYDLTRHEDTIHNIRKQKVRCAICTEEKTFSRSDALTRHMRVVHPEVDFPGKHRKRGSRDEA